MFRIWSRYVWSTVDRQNEHRISRVGSVEGKDSRLYLEDGLENMF